MTVDEVKAELKRVRQAKQIYRLTADRANDYEQTITGGKTVRYGGNGESHEKRGNPVENAYCELISLKEDKEQHRREYIAAFNRFNSVKHACRKAEQGAVYKPYCKRHLLRYASG